MRRTSRCSASTAPLPQRAGAQGALAARREAKKRDHRRSAGSRSVHLSPVGAGAAFGWQGTTLTTRSRTTAEVLSGRLCRGEDAAHLQQGVVGTVRPLETIPAEPVPHRIRRGNDETQAMNCPGHFLTYASEMPVSRPAAAFHEQTPLQGTSLRCPVGPDTRPAIPQDDAHLLCHQGRSAKKWSS